MMLIDDLDKLRAYTDGVMRCANGHAQELIPLFEHLLGALLVRGRGPIKVSSYDGKPGSMAWWTSARTGKTYSFVHNDDLQRCILVRTNRQIVHSLDAATLHSVVSDIVSRL